MIKRLLVFSASILFVLQASGQPGSYRQLPAGLISQGMSPSGNFITGLGGGGSFLYKTTDSSLFLIGGNSAYDCTDFGVVAGTIDTIVGAVTAEVAAIYNAGAWRSLPSVPGGGYVTGTGSYSDAFGISNNGEVVCGFYWSNASKTTAYSYNTSTQQYTTFPDFGQSAKASVISGNGQVVAGWCQTNNRVPVRWNPAATLMSTGGECYGINTDGSFIAASGSGAFGSVPILWDSAAGQVTILPLPANADDGQALGVSDNGITVGYFNAGFSRFGFIYIPGQGTFELSSYLTGLGIPNVGNVSWPQNISKDGRYISGITNTFPRQAWFVDVGSVPTYTNQLQAESHQVIAYPNPATGDKTSFTFKMSDIGDVSLQVLDMKGSLISNTDFGQMQSGIQEISWDLKDANGNRVAEGYYPCIINAGKKSTKLFVYVQ
ncbi:MAG: FlgD immunoglobulin-like domain containing protein [Bacteroidota bacterium]